MTLTSTAILSIVVSWMWVAVGALVDPARQYPLDSGVTNHSLNPALDGLWGWQSAKLFDRFGTLRSDDEKARLDNFVVELQANPGAKGYIIVFYQRGKSPTHAKKRADNAKNYLIYYRGLDNSRFVSWDHCSRAKVEYELWVVWDTDDFNRRYEKRCTPLTKRIGD